MLQRSNRLLLEGQRASNVTSNYNLACISLASYICRRIFAGKALPESNSCLLSPKEGLGAEFRTAIALFHDLHSATATYPSLRLLEVVSVSNETLY